MRLQFKRKRKSGVCGIKGGRTRTVLYMVNKKVNNMNHGKCYGKGEKVIDVRKYGEYTES